MRIAIYTCLVGNYDDLYDPVVKQGYDYICFTDNVDNKQSNVWKFRNIPYKCEDLTRLSRFVKILPHIALPEYDYSLWIDANIQIIDNSFYDIIENLVSLDVLIAQVSHNRHNCVYEDIKHAYKREKVHFKDAFRQYKHLIEEGYPKDNGLFENNLILRKNNAEKVVRISESWWKEYVTYSKRDQFSLVYVYWLNNFKPALIFENGLNTRNADCLKYHGHNPKPKIGSPATMYNALCRVIRHILHFFISPIMLKKFSI